MDKIIAKVYLGADTESYELKNKLKDLLQFNNFFVVDLGVFDIEEPCDASVIAREVTEKVLENKDNCEDAETPVEVSECDVYGVLLSGNGVMMNDAANAVGGVMSVMPESVDEAVKHRTSGARIVSVATREKDTNQVESIVLAFLKNEK
jgi:ribose 5-phosphate isomerase RpiB